MRTPLDPTFLTVLISVYKLPHTTNPTFNSVNEFYSYIIKNNVFRG